MNLKVLEKSRKLLVQVMGQEDFDKFMEDGKIEVKHYIDDEAGRPREVVYELDQDARVYNKTKSQSYCIEPICPDNLPLHDQLAIKYGYLKNNIKRVEEVANKRGTTPYETPRNHGILEGLSNALRMRIAGTDDTEIGFATRIRHYGAMPSAVFSAPRPAGYSEYVEYLEGMGWRRSQITLDEHNNRIVTVDNANRNCNGQVIDVRCPAGQKISIMGVQQVSMRADARTAHSFRARLADEEDNEIPYSTCISIRKEKTTEAIIQIARLFYSDINLTLEPRGSSPDRPLESLRLKTDDQQYRFRQGIELNGEDHLKLYAIDCESNIVARNCRFALDCDLWCM